MTLKDQALKLLKWAEKKKFQAEVYMVWSESVRASWKNDDIDRVDFRRSQGVGLLIQQGTRTAFVDSNDLSDAGLQELLERAIALFRFAEEDPGYVMPEGPLPALTPMKLVDLTYKQLTPEALVDHAKSVVQAYPRSSLIGLKKGSAQKSRAHVVLVTSKGMEMERWSTSFSLGAEVRLDQKGEKMEGYAGWSRRFWDQLPPADRVAQEAFQRAKDVLGGKPIPTDEMPVVFAPVVGTRLLWAIFQALQGENLNKNRSFIAGRLGKPLFSPLLTVIEDPAMEDAPGSTPVDDEGVPTQRKVLVDQGVPKLPVDNLRSAKEGGREPTGNGFRSYRYRPGIGLTNLYMQPGEDTPEEIIASIDRGFYVMGTLGFGLDVVSGNFSTGAYGRLISNGALSDPVQGVTISLGLEELYATIDRVANDLEFRGSLATPTFMVRQMKIAGKD